MRELMITNDPVVLSFAESLLKEAGIAATVLDRHISALEGSIGAFPRRVLVAPDDWPQARRILADADLGRWLVGEDG